MSIISACVSSALAASGAQAVGGTTDAVQRTIIAQTGSTAAAVTSTRTVTADVIVKPARTSTGQLIETYFQDHGQDGYAQFAVLHSGQTSARFDIDVPEGSHLVALPTGEVAIVDTGAAGKITIRGMAAAPWAVDAHGKKLMTNYRVVDNDTVEQVVNTTKATFPVVADPKWSLGWYITAPVAYAKYSRTETSKIAGAGNNVKYGGLIACAGVPTGVGAAVCGAVINAMWDDIKNTAVAANRAGRCLTIRMPLHSALWAFDAINDRCA